MRRGEGDEVDHAVEGTGGQGRPQRPRIPGVRDHNIGIRRKGMRGRRAAVDQGHAVAAAQRLGRDRVRDRARTADDQDVHGFLLGALTRRAGQRSVSRPSEWQDGP